MKLSIEIVGEDYRELFLQHETQPTRKENETMIGGFKKEDDIKPSTCNDETEQLAYEILRKHDAENLNAAEALMRLMESCPDVVNALTKNIKTNKETEKENKSTIYANLPELKGQFRNFTLLELYGIFTKMNGCCGRVYLALQDIVLAKRTSVEKKTVNCKELTEIVGDAFCIELTLGLLKEMNLIKFYVVNSSEKSDDEYVVQFNFDYLPAVITDIMQLEITNLEHYFVTHGSELKKTMNYLNDNARALRAPIVSTAILDERIRTSLHVGCFFLEYLLENGTTPSFNEIKEYLRILTDKQTMDILQFCGNFLYGLGEILDNTGKFVDGMKDTTGILIFDIDDFVSIVQDIATLYARGVHSNEKKLLRGPSFAKINPDDSIIMGTTTTLKQTLLKVGELSYKYANLCDITDSKK